MDRSEIWLTKLFNEYLAGLGNWFLTLVGLPASARPWQNYICAELLVVLIIMVLFAVLRGSLSVARPGKFQQIFELVYEFMRGQADDFVGHAGRRYLAFFGTLFIFVLFCNLIGIIPGTDAPTMYPYVPCGCALATFLYYNIAGVQENGAWKYLKHFFGPMLGLAPLMFAIEIVGNLARPLSLTLRLYGNMFAGESVTTIFQRFTYVGIPVIFMGLHAFVAFLQAYVFMALTMIYVAGAVAHEEH
jgi:F-type H+-transporting ATPase subunit a